MEASERAQTGLVSTYVHRLSVGILGNFLIGVYQYEPKKELYCFIFTSFLKNSTNMWANKLF